MLIKCNDYVIADNAIIPVLFRKSVVAAATKLQVMLSGWDSEISNLRVWHMT